MKHLKEISFLFIACSLLLSFCSKKDAVIVAAPTPVPQPPTPVVDTTGSTGSGTNQNTNPPMDTLFALQGYGDAHLYDVQFTAANTVLAAGANGTVISSSDTGNTWTKINTGTAKRLNQLEVINRDTIFVSGNAVLLQSINGGQSWNEINHPAEEDLISIDFLNSKTGFIGTKAGKLYQTNDGGITWTTLYTATGAITNVQFFTSRWGVISGEKNLFLRTRDGGLSWQNLNKDYFNLSTLQVYLSDTTKGFAVSNLPGLFSTTIYRALINNLSVWNPSPPLESAILDLYIQSSTHAYAVNKNTIHYTTDGGSVWKRRRVNSQIEFNSVASASDSTALMVGNSGKMMRFKRLL